jgi:hypothetical protein
MRKSISSGDIFPKIIWEAQSRSKLRFVPDMWKKRVLAGFLAIWLVW